MRLHCCPLPGRGLGRDVHAARVRATRSSALPGPISARPSAIEGVQRTPDTSQRCLVFWRCMCVGWLGSSHWPLISHQV